MRRLPMVRTQAYLEVMMDLSATHPDTHLMDREVVPVIV